MRELLNIFEDKTINPKELEAFKSVIASKIKQLPADDATNKTLKEIEELLQHVHAGGRMGMIKGELTAINDPAISAAQKRLAQYIASMEVSPKDRAELFKLWKADKIVKIDKLLSKDKVTFKDIFEKYGVNQAITELVDDVMSEAALGQGKGEFGLNVLSKSVSKAGGLGEYSSSEDEEVPEEQKGKGDLIIKQGGKWRKVECKTTHGGAARFSDQEVRPAEGYEAAAANLNRFVESYKGTDVYAAALPKGLAKGYGLNFRSAVEFYSLLPAKDKTKFLDMVNTVVTLIFGGKAADKKRVNAIMTAFKAGDGNAAIQYYSQACFSYYMSKKDDDGVLAIDLNQKSMVFYSSAEDLTKQKLRFNADTIYLTARDVARGAYPQMSVVDTSFGANAKAAAKAQADALAAKQHAAWAKEKPIVPQKGARQSIAHYQTAVTEFARDLAARRGVGNARTVKAIFDIVYPLATNGVSNDTIYRNLIKAIPALKVGANLAQPALRESQIGRARR